jgi:hypothetical protein
LEYGTLPARIDLMAITVDGPDDDCAIRMNLSAREQSLPGRSVEIMTHEKTNVSATRITGASRAMARYGTWGGHRSECFPHAPARSWNAPLRPTTARDAPRGMFASHHVVA